MTTNLNLQDLTSQLNKIYDLLDMYNVSPAMQIIQSLINQIDSFNLEIPTSPTISNFQLSMSDIDITKQYRVVNVNPTSPYSNKVVNIIKKRKKYILVELPHPTSPTLFLVPPYLLEEV